MKTVFDDVVKNNGSDNGGIRGGGGRKKMIENVKIKKQA